MSYLSGMMRHVGGAVVMVAIVWLATPTVNQSYRPPLLETARAQPGTAEEFRWESPFQAARYRFTIRDAKGGLIFTGEVSAPPFRPDPVMRSQLSAGESYTWKVESLDRAAATIAESLPVTFRYQP
jgi:hypothetical protein